MLHLLDYTAIVNLFTLVINFLCWRRIRSIQNVQDEEDIEIVDASMFLNIIVQWFQLMGFFFSWMFSRRSRLLINPHMMLELMPGYRIGLNGQNLWNFLDRNWIHFFWLTGETPDTLNILVECLRNIYYVQNHLGRPPAIDFRNQVSSV